MYAIRGISSSLLIMLLICTPFTAFYTHTLPLSLRVTTSKCIHLYGERRWEWKHYGCQSVLYSQSSHLQARSSTLHTGPWFRWPRKLHLCVITRHMQKCAATWKYHPMCQENFARYNSPYSCKKQNSDRQKSGIGAVFEPVTDALTV